MVERSEGGLRSVWTLCGYSGSDKLSYNLTNLTPGKRWLIRVYADSDDGRSEPLETSLTTDQGFYSTILKFQHACACYYDDIWKSFDNVV